MSLSLAGVVLAASQIPPTALTRLEALADSEGGLAAILSEEIQVAANSGTFAPGTQVMVTLDTVAAPAGLEDAQPLGPGVRVSASDPALRSVFVRMPAPVGYDRDLVVPAAVDPHSGSWMAVQLLEFDDGVLVAELRPELLTSAGGRVRGQAALLKQKKGIGIVFGIFKLAEKTANVVRVQLQAPKLAKAVDWVDKVLAGISLLQIGKAADQGRSSDARCQAAALIVCTAFTRPLTSSQDPRIKGVGVIAGAICERITPCQASVGPTPAAPSQNDRAGFAPAPAQTPRTQSSPPQQTPRSTLAPASTPNPLSAPPSGPPAPEYVPSFPGQTVSIGGNNFRSDDGRTWIFQGTDAERARNAPLNPSTFRLLSPPHGVSFPIDQIVEFSWECTTDERGGAVQYQLKIFDIVSVERRNGAGATREYRNLPPISSCVFTPPASYFRTGFEYEWGVEAISNTNTKRDALGLGRRFTVTEPSPVPVARTPIPSPSGSQSPTGQAEPPLPTPTEAVPSSVPSPTAAVTVLPSVTPSSTASASPSPSAAESPSPAPSPEPAPTPAPTTAPAGEWIWCAHEQDRCDLAGTAEVRYGASGTFVTKLVTGGIHCSNDNFGDPIPGTEKDCYYRGADSSPSPTPTPSPTPSATPAPTPTPVAGFRIEATVTRTEVRTCHANAEKIVVQMSQTAANEAFSLGIRDGRVEFGLSGSSGRVWAKTTLLTGAAMGSAKSSPGPTYQITATYDGTALRVFVNGELDGQQAYSGGISPQDGPLFQGTNDVGHDCWDGTFTWSRFDTL